MRQPHARTSAASALTLLLALGCPAASQAQSHVQVNGLIDLGVYRGFDGRKHLGTIQRSNIAVSGTEDLGAGLAATFLLSHRLDADTGALEGAGSKPFWQGESTVGLKGGFGHLRVGRALDVVYGLDWSYDPWQNFDRVASPAWNLWHYNYASSRTSNNGSAEYGRLANGVFYEAPSLAGFTLHASGSFEQDTAPGAGRSNNGGLSLNYAGGGFKGMLAAARNSSGDTVQFVGARFDQGSWALMAAYDRSVYKATTDSVSRVYTVGATYALGATTWKGSYGHQDLDGRSTDFLGLGASHALSKRTSVYISAGRIDTQTQPARSAWGTGIAHSF